MDNIKRFLGDDSVFYGLLIALVALTAYGLGKHSEVRGVAATAKSEVVLLETAPETTENRAEADDSQLVASKNGTKYHYLWCPGASQMKEENKIFFDSIEAARAAGYTPASNCKGLE